MYEQKGHERLIDEHGFTNYFPGQWFQYQLMRGGIKFCQTDGLLFQARQRKVLIVEFKYKHTAKAYQQIEEKYIPVVGRIFRDWEISVCEICKWYDPSTPFPVDVRLVRDPLMVQPGEFGVHIWKP